MKKWLSLLALAACLVTGNANADTWYNRFRDAGDIPFTQSGTGAVASNVLAKLKQYEVSIADFTGADSTGVADSRTALVNAIASLPSGGGTIFFPKGSWKIGCGTISITKPLALVGDAGATVYNSCATGDVFSVSGVTGFFVDGLTVNAAVTRTSGALFKIASSSVGVISRFSFNGQYNAIIYDGAVHMSAREGSIRNGTANATSAGSCQIIVGPTTRTTAITLDNILMDAASGAQPTCGVKQMWSDGGIMRGLDIIHQGTDLLIQPLSGQTTSALYVIQSYFDTAVTGITVSPVGTGLVFGSKFVNTWTNSHSAFGTWLDGTSANILDTDFINHVSSLNGNNGFHLNGAGVSGVRIIASQAGQNTGNAGVFMGTNASNIKILQSVLGAYPSRNGNAYGVYSDGTATTCEVGGNDMSSNTTAAIANLSACTLYGNTPVANFSTQSYVAGTGGAFVLPNLTGYIKGAGTSSATASASVPVADISGTLPVSKGGTGASLSATGGTSQVLKQTSVGGNVTVGQLAASDLSNGTTGSGSAVLSNTPSLTTPSMTTPSISGAAVLTTTPSSAWNLDCSGTNTGSVANGGTYALQNGAGLVLLQDTSATGTLALFMVGGTASSLIAQTGTLFANTVTAGKVSLAWDGGGPYYKITNNGGGAITFNVCDMRVRTVGN